MAARKRKDSLEERAAARPDRSAKRVERSASGKRVARAPSAGRQLSFHSTVESWAAGMEYYALPVPESVTRALGTKGPVLVLARLNDSEPFEVSLFPAGGGQHYIRIRAKVRKETKIRYGDRVRVRITVLDRADVTIPDDLTRALRAAGLAKDFASLPPGKKNYAVRRIEDAARPETRSRRIEEAVEAARERRERRTDRPK